jgi:hypothetical protein
MNWHNANVRASACRSIIQSLWSIIELRFYSMQSINDAIMMTSFILQTRSFPIIRV